ncbi:MAG: hypothetical protein LPH21_12940 [Shewanella sp.]|nr:hypothetical protein [Shewanella sp.]
MERYDPGNPTGWRSAGVCSFPVDGELLKATTPFFASENGTHWVQCRNVRVTRFNGYEDVEQVTCGRLEVKLIPQDEGVALSSQTITGVDQRFTLSIKVNKEEDPTTYTTPAYEVALPKHIDDNTIGAPDQATMDEILNNCAPPRTFKLINSPNEYSIMSAQHYWRCSHIQADTVGTGKVPFAADFIGNELIEIDFNLNHDVSYLQQWGMGVDGRYFDNKQAERQDEVLVDDDAGFVVVGHSNSTAIAYSYWPQNAEPLATTGVSQHLFRFGKRSDGWYSDDPYTINNSWPLELAYNSEATPVATPPPWNYTTTPLRPGDGSTTAFQQHIHASYLRFKDAYLYLCQQDQMTEGELDFDKRPHIPYADRVVNRRRYIRYLDIRNGAMNYIADVEVDEIHYARSINNATHNRAMSCEVEREKRHYIEVNSPGQEEEKYLIEDPESVESVEQGDLFGRWTFYPQPWQEAGMSVVEWPGEPSALPQPPLTASWAFDVDTTTYDPGLSKIRMGMIKYGRDTSYSYALPGNLPSEGWEMADGSLYGVPPVLNQPMAVNNFQWEVEYFSYEVEWPDQDKDINEEHSPKVYTFHKGSPIFDRELNDYMKLISPQDLHKRYNQYDMTVSAALGKTGEFLFALTYSTSDGAQGYYSYFSGTDSPLDDFIRVGQSFHPVGAL